VTAIGQAPERTFSPREVQRMVETGILRADEPVELLEGRLVLVSPQGPPHASVVGALAERLRTAYPSGYAVREEKPLELPESLPEPDIAVVLGTQLDYAKRHPNGEDAQLVVEVAVTSQELDHAKARLYARAHVRVLWLLDIPARRLEVHTEPQQDGRYRVVQVLGDDDEVSPPGASARWKVRELLG
jgi:Uma2 family endonuclease